MELKPLDAGAVVGFVLLDLLIIIVAARIVGGLFRRMGQPRVVGEIVAGVLLGPTLLGPTLWKNFQAPSWLHCDRGLVLAAEGTLASPTQCLFPTQARGILGAIGQIALLIFMFLVGLELDVSRLKGKVLGVVLVGIGVVVLPVGLGFAVAPMMAGDIFKPADATVLGFTLFVGAMMAVTAFPVMARILQEKGLTTTPMGIIGISAAAVTTIAMFLVVASAASIAGGGSSSGLALKIGLSFVYLAVMFLVVRPALEPMGRKFTAGGMDGGVFATIFMVLLASSYVAHQLGINVIVGGFIAGMVLPARAPMFAAMSERLSEVTGTVLLPVFLAFSGLGTDFTKLSAAALPGLAVFLVAGIVSKWAGGAVFARVGGLSWQEGNVLGILMNCRGLLVLVVSLVGVQQGVITPVMQLGGVLMALITTAMTGPLFDKFSAKLAPVPAVASAPAKPPPGRSRRPART